MGVCLTERALKRTNENLAFSLAAVQRRRRRVFVTRSRIDDQRTHRPPAHFTLQKTRLQQYASA